MVTCPLWEIITTTEDYVSAETATWFATQIIALSYALELDALGDSMLDISHKRLSLGKISTGAECIGAIILSMERIPYMQQLMYVVPSRM